jgi:YhcH/YjgK/YiaL family protein
MIVDRLEKAEKYLNLHPAFAAAFAFLRRNDLADLPLDKHILDGHKAYGLISRSPGRSRAESPLEAHRKYIDIQYIVDGCDEMGWKPLAACKEIRTEYNADKDVLFFKDEPESWTEVPAGSFAIFFPEDAHAPMAGQGIIHKVVIKVAVE